MNTELTTNQNRNHSSLFKVMHWLMAALIFAAFVIAWTVDDMKFSPEKLKLINYHKWVGFTVLLLVAPRFITSLAGYKKLAVITFEDAIAKIVHHVLYVLMVATPILGWLMSSAKGFQIVLFGLVEIPDLIQKNDECAKFLKEAHELSATILLIIIGLHVAGAIKRQFIKKDKIISNMFWGKN